MVISGELDLESQLLQISYSISIDKYIHFQKPYSGRTILCWSPKFYTIICGNALRQFRWLRIHSPKIHERFLRNRNGSADFLEIFYIYDWLVNELEGPTTMENFWSSYTSVLHNTSTSFDKTLNGERKLLTQIRTKQIISINRWPSPQTLTAKYYTYHSVKTKLRLLKYRLEMKRKMTATMTFSKMMDTILTRTNFSWIRQSTTEL